jgi:ABC-type glycerol-3-phosphate transport system substrate-binding protein
MLLVSTAALVIAGCSMPSATPDPAASPSAPPPTVTPVPSPTEQVAATPTSLPGSTLGVDEAKLHGLHVRFWYSGPVAFQAAMDERLRAFNAANPQGIWVEGTYFGSFADLTAQIQTAGDDQRPDAALVYPALAAGWTAEAIRPVDLRPYLDDPVWGLSAADRADYPAGMLPPDGQPASGLPGYRTGGFLFYNQSWASALGFNQPPQTPDEFQKQACAAAKANNQARTSDKTGTGGWIASNDTTAALSWIAGFGGKPGQGFQLNSDATSQAFGYLNGLFAQGCAWVARNPDPSGYFANRQALFISADSGDILDQEAGMGPKASPDRWTVIPYPTADGSGVAFGDGPDYMVLPGRPERQLAAWIFIRSISSVEDEAALAAGSGVFPVRISAKGALSDMLSGHPQWGAAFEWLAKLQPVPSQPEWVTVRPILEDAVGQLYQINTKPEMIPSIVNMLDQTIQEVMGRNQ